MRRSRWSRGALALLVLAVLLVPTSAVAEEQAPAVPAASVLDAGARGDGVTDDTRALQRALDALEPGDTLTVPAGRTFRHDDVLVVRVPDVRIIGGGVLLATRQERSAVFLDADRVHVEGLVLRTVADHRWYAYEQMGLRLGAHDGISVQDVRIEGAAAAGVYVGGSTNFALTDVRVAGSRADGIHVTEAAHDGTIVRPVVSCSGDDGVAVVSYGSQSRPVRRVTITSPTVRRTTWGRGLSVVGGQDITMTDVHTSRTDAAAIYIASEGAPFFTQGVQGVRISGGELDSSNTDAAVDHGAVLVYDGHEGRTISDVVVEDLTIRDTRRSASRQVGLVSDSGAGIARVRLSDLRVLSGGRYAFWANVPRAGYNRTGWTQDGSPLPDLLGW